MKQIQALIFLCACWSVTAPAQSRVTLTVDTKTTGLAVPSNFTGLSFGMKTLAPDKDGGHFFSPTNTALITLFQNTGLTHLRMGGTTVEWPLETPIPGEAEIDGLFAFARAAGIPKIIYSLRLLETDPAKTYIETNAIIARYIWSHYRPQLEAFSIGNEPDRGGIYKQDSSISNFSSFRAKWEKFAAAITNAAPGATFAGPDAGSGNISWTTRFANAEKEKSGLLVTEHFYAGGAGKGLSAEQGIEAMLEPTALKASQRLFKKMAQPVLETGLPYRFTEANDHYSGGAPDASDTFAGALWALDFLHWWSEHETQGIDFHNTEWVSSDVIAPDADGHLTLKPKGYGIKAFNLGCHGTVAPVEIANSDELNLSAYAVRDEKNLVVTIINKEHGKDARTADIVIFASGAGKQAETISLTAPQGDVKSKAGIMLGGAAIPNDGPWSGKWTSLKSKKTGQCVVKVSATSAVIVKIALD